MSAQGAGHIHRQFEDAFNRGDLDALVALFEDDAALVRQPGTVVRGRDELGPALQQLLDLGGTITLDTKGVVERVTSPTSPTVGR